MKKEAMCLKESKKDIQKELKGGKEEELMQF